MTDIVISPEHNDYRLAGTLAFLDLGPDNARILVCDGERPSPGGTLTNVLVTLPLDKPSGTIASHVLTLLSSAMGLVMITGTATWARVINGNGDWVQDCDVSDLDGSATIKLEGTALLFGATTQLASGVLR